MNTIQLIFTTIGAVIGIALGIGTLVGILIRYMLVPFLAEKFVLLEETHKQVSENRHSNETPTVLDRIEEVKTQSDRIEALAVKSQEEVKSIARRFGEMFDGHIEWSQREVDAVWAELKRKRDRNA